MKKAFKIIFTVLATLAVLNCGGTVEVPDEPEDKPVNPTPGPEPGGDDNSFGGDVVFQATIESLSNGTQPGWRKGESISIFDGATVVKASNTEEDGAIAKFPATIKKGAESVFALYPAKDGIQMTATGVSLEIPAVQNLGEEVPSFRVAKSTSELLYFRNLVAVANLTLTFDGATSIKLTAAGEGKIGGVVSVDYSGESPVVAASSATVELKGELKKGEKYPIVLAPANLTNCTVEVYSADKVIAHFDTGALNLASGAVVDMQEISKDMPIYHITHMWLWGGTMPEWGCSATFDLFDKSDQFNKEDGRGIDALKDNYLEFNSDGTFHNWAGEDARNWWFVYNGAHNSEGGVDLDLKEFFDVLPRASATYTIAEDSTVVFTLPDGTTKRATLVSKGTYMMPQTDDNGKEPKYITITTQALRFEITGGRDNYGEDVNIIYKDYWKICAHPRTLFIEIEQMPDGFEIPASACTTDADFEFVPPKYTFNMESLPGTWNVFGGNSAPYGLWVNGGSGSDPAFISPIDKAWCWNSSVYSESDNTLTVAITSYTQTAVSGTIDWEAGADGAFWDCIWNRLNGVASDSHFGEDLSKYFSHIPKGVSNFSVNLATGAGKIGEDIDFTFLLPGMHSFTCGKRLEIVSDCFGLAFHNMDAIPVVDADHYTDVDRFVNAPLDYVIIFEKK